jgi:uncharacterized membrane protein (UPF0136 family)
MERNPDKKRARVAFIFIVLLGYILGFFLKRVQLGLILGLAIGLLATGLTGRRR